MLTLLLTTVVLSAQSSLGVNSLNTAPDADVAQALLGGCSLSLNHDNVECFGDLAGLLEVDITTLVEGDHTFTWTYQEDSGGPFLPLPSSIPVMEVMYLPAYDTPTFVTSYTDIPAGFYFLTVTGPSLPNGEQIFCEAAATIIVKDIEPPTITCPLPQVVTAPIGECEATIDVSALAAVIDSCGVILEADVAEVTASVGETVVPVVYTATDDSGNVTVAQCDVMITVRDEENPTIECPANINMDTDNAECNAIVTWEITADDNCEAVVTTMCIFPGGSGVPEPCMSGMEYPLGTTIVLGTATDPSGNEATCAFEITVEDGESPIVDCPNDITVNNDPGECGAIVDFMPTATDNCGVASNGTDIESGTFFALGETVVTYTATDAAGNSTTCDFTVTVLDNEPPALDCPANVTMLTSTSGDTYDCMATVPDFIPGLNNGDGSFGDNCAATPVQDPAPGTPWGGSHQATQDVTITVTDAAGNSTSCSLTLTLIDDENPTIDCPSDITVDANANCEAVVSWGVPPTDDNCAVASVTSTHEPGETFSQGATIVTYTVTDVAGLSTECSFEVTVVDTAPPVAECHSTNVDVTKDADENCEATHSWTNPVLVDNCENEVSVAATCIYPDGSTAPCASGDTFPLGTTQITFPAPADVCDFDVTIVDNTPPTVDPQDITMQTGDNDVYDCIVTVPNYEDEFIDGAPNPLYNAADNCDVTVTQDPAPGTPFEDGGVCADPIVVTVTATDGVSTVVETATVTLNDNVDPLITCPADITVTPAAGDCDGEEVTILVPVFVEPTLDANGDPIAPTNPTDPATGAYTDDCDCVTLSGPDTDVALDATNTGTFPIGTTTVSYTATDAAGNSATCTFTVTVLPPDPVIVCNGSDTSSATVDADANCEATHSWPSPTVEACDMSTPIDATCVYPDGTSAPCASGDTFPLGTTNITYPTAPQCNLSVTVVDNTPPTVDPQDVTMQTGDNDVYDCIVTVPNYEDEFIDGVANPLYNGADNCNVVVTQDPAPGTPFEDGGVCADPITVTVTATDGISTVVETATVTLNDNVDPLITCPADITVTPAAGDCDGEEVTILVPVFVQPTLDANGDPIAPTNPTDPATGAYTDDCDCVTLSGPDTDVALDATNTGTFPIGTTTVSYTATDAAGNSATCTFTVTVLPPDPVIMCNGSGDSSTTIDADANCEATHTWPSPTVDACDEMTPIPATCVYPDGTSAPCASGDAFPLGTTEVTFAGTVGCNFTVIVVDNTAPTLTCPADVTMVTSASGDADDCVALVPDFIPGLDAGTDGSYDDNCSATVTQFPLPGTPWGGSHEATQLVTITVEDGANPVNTISCDFTLTLIDDEDPIFTSCPSDMTVPNDAGECGAVVDFVVVADDNCTVTVGGSHDSGDTFPVGTTTVTYTATDGAGNSATCSFDITVEDEEDPVLTCPADIVVDNDSGICGAVVTFDPTFTDNCPDATDAISHVSGSIFPVGTTTVTYTATDDAGNTATCEFDITVTDNEPPTFDGDNVTIPTSANGVYDCGVPVPNYVDEFFADGSANPDWINLEDNCGAFATQDVPPGTIVGTCHGQEFPVVITVSDDKDNDGVLDADGMTYTETVTVTLDDDVDPLIACPDNITINTMECTGVEWPIDPFSLVEEMLDANGNPLPLEDYTYADDCSTAAGCLVFDYEIDNDVVLSDGGSGTGTFPPGTTTLTYTVTDGAGNTATCSYTVTVIVEEELTFNCPSTIKVSNDEGECGADVYWNPPVVFGECTGPGGSIVIPANCTYPNGTTAPCASGDFFPVGITTVVMGDEDDNCSFEVRVLDTEKPILECPEDITVSVAGQGCKAWVTWERPIPTDNCGVVSYNGTHTHSGMYFPVGTTTVIYKAVDAAGNTGTCNFTITVTDDLDPAASCPDDITLAAPGTASWTPPNPVDNCVANGVLIAATHEPGDFFDETTTVTYIFEDAAGNTDECSFTVNVNTGTSPRVAGRVAMEGASMNGGGMMRDDLRMSPLMPASFGLLSPYGGTSAISTTMLSGTSNTNSAVDWILIEIRDANNPAQVLMTKSALVQRDGDIMAADGSSSVALAGLTNGNYHVAIRHRNHLGVMTATPVYLDANAPMLDFTDANFQTWGTNAQVNVNGKMVMIAGDSTGDGAVTAADRSDIWNNRNTQSYMTQDCDMNGATTAADRNISYNNRNTVQQLPQ